MASASTPFLKNISKMLTGPKSPIGPPIPKKEILRVLRALRAQIDRWIDAVERSGAAPAAAPARKRARKKAARS